MFGSMSDVCSNVLESCVCVMYITLVIICLFVDQHNRKLHTVVPPYPLIQYLQFQLCTSYHDLKKLER
jgi:hypothetical protein